MEHQHAPGEECPKCWAKVSTPLFCESCKAILPATANPSPFDALGVEPSYPIDAMALRKRLLTLSRQLHPDFHIHADTGTRALAERNTAELNAAFEILSDDFRRADWIVKSLAGPSESDERQMPSEFLAEVMEWNETVEDARDAPADSPARAELDPLATSLEEQRARVMSEISDRLVPLPEAHAPVLREVRRRLNAVRYIDRTLGEIAELRLADASSER